MTFTAPSPPADSSAGRVDLHMHTTASDGRCTPRELVDRAEAAGLAVMAVTDHDTTLAVAEVCSAAAARGIHAIPGIEITAIESGRDVHMLGYFIDAASIPLTNFLAEQRASRLSRVEAIGERLTALGMPIDTGHLISAGRSTSGRSLGRPQVARAMVAAGYVADTREAFDQWLVPGRPAFVPRSGPSPEVVIEIVHAAGGLVSLAHPGRTRIDARIGELHDAGLDAIEAFHSDHEPEIAQRYERMAHDLGLLVTGGSDYHGDPSRPIAPGSTVLPWAHWSRLDAARPRHAGA